VSLRRAIASARLACEHMRPRYVALAEPHLSGGFLCLDLPSLGLHVEVPVKPMATAEEVGRALVKAMDCDGKAGGR
jgi:hypothetical protein